MTKWLLCIFLFASCSTVKPVTEMLNGSKSYDPDGYIVKWYWRQITPYSAIILNPSGVITSVVLKKKGAYQFELTVTDNQGAKGKDTLLITY